MNHFYLNHSLPSIITRRATRKASRVLGAIDGLLGAVSDRLCVWQRRQADRRLLSSLDDRMLRDIGLSFVEVEHEASKPFWRD